MEAEVPNYIFRCGQIMGIASTINPSVMRDYLASGESDIANEYRTHIELVLGLTAAVRGAHVTMTIHREGQG